MVRALLALFSGSRLADGLAEVDHESNMQELARDGVTDVPPKRIDEMRQEMRRSTRDSLSRLRKNLVLSGISILSAIAAAAAVRWVNLGMHFSGRTLAIGSMFCFAWATLGRLGWRSWGERTTIERLDRVVFHILYWIGAYLGAAAFY